MPGEDLPKVQHLFLETFPFVRKDVLVVGGGNSAGQAAVFLSRHARHVHILVRGDGLAASMSDYLIGRIDAKAQRDKGTLHLRALWLEPGQTWDQLGENDAPMPT